MTDTIRHGVAQSAREQGIALDPAQQELLDELSTRVGAALTAHAATGLFVHGPAGRGKTWLMSEVYAAAPVPPEAKRRVHFHAFFQQLQRRFGAMLSARAAIDETVAELLDGTRVFFFDELHVHDPGGAALLNGLLDELPRRGAVTLITSNYEPEGLLPNPIYHHVVEPGIRTIREHFTVRTLDGGADYRRQRIDARSGFASGRWVAVPGGSVAEPGIRAAGYTAPAADERTSVLEDHHAIPARAVRGREIWFEFAELLERPSSPDDYLALGAEFDAWVLLGVPPLSRMSREARQRFVTLIDVLADLDLPLVAFAEVDRDALDDIADTPPDFFRAESRLALLREG